MEIMLFLIGIVIIILLYIKGLDKDISDSNKEKQRLFDSLEKERFLNRNGVKYDDYNRFEKNNLELHRVNTTLKKENEELKKKNVELKKWVEDLIKWNDELVKKNNKINKDDIMDGLI